MRMRRPCHAQAVRAMWPAAVGAASAGAVPCFIASSFRFAATTAPPSADVSKLMPRGMRHDAGQVPPPTAPPPAALKESAPNPEKAWCDEPTLEDLDISIPQVDCTFVAELVHRRLTMRDEMHLPRSERTYVKQQQQQSGAAPAAEDTRVFRAPVEDDHDLTGREVVAQKAPTSTGVAPQAAAKPNAGEDSGENFQTNRGR